MLRRDLFSALVEVRGRRLRCEGIQPEVVELLWKHGDRQGCRLFFIDLQIQLGERIEALKLHIALQRRQTLDGCANEAVFKRLSERESIFYQRPVDSGPRSESFNSNNVTIPVSGPRDDVLQ